MYAIREGDITKSGFLCDPGLWNPEVAEALAEAEGIELTDVHWLMLNAIRSIYATYEVPPTYHVVRQEIEGTLLPFENHYSHVIRHLFPKGGIKQASRIAGLPDYFCFGC
jgi:tRNA 2-thiouridine synthesizing protein E